MLDGEEAGIAEVDPGDDPQNENAVAWWTLVDVQHQTTVKELYSHTSTTTASYDYNQILLHSSQSV